MIFLMISWKFRKKFKWTKNNNKNYQINWVRMSGANVLRESSKMRFFWRNKNHQILNKISKNFMTVSQTSILDKNILIIRGFFFDFFSFNFFRKKQHQDARHMFILLWCGWIDRTTPNLNVFVSSLTRLFLFLLSWIMQNFFFQKFTKQLAHLWDWLKGAFSYFVSKRKLWIAR